MIGVTRVGQRSFASNQRCPYQRDNADWAASSWRQWCAAPVLYSQPATSNGVVSGSRYRGVARISNPSAHDGVLGTQRLLIAGQACWARFLAIAKAITNKLIDVDDDGHAEYMSAK